MISLPKPLPVGLLCININYRREGLCILFARSCYKYGSPPESDLAEIHPPAEQSNEGSIRYSAKTSINKYFLKTAWITGLLPSIRPRSMAFT
jgi:hypothetical protein